MLCRSSFTMSSSALRKSLSTLPTHNTNIQISPQLLSCYRATVSNRSITASKLLHRAHSSSSGRLKKGDSQPTTKGSGGPKSNTTFLQRWMAPREMPPRWTLRWYGEMVLICTVFAITGSSTMVLVSGDDSCSVRCYAAITCGTHLFIMVHVATSDSYVKYLILQCVGKHRRGALLTSSICSKPFVGVNFRSALPYQMCLV